MLLLCTQGERNNPFDPGASNTLLPRINFIKPSDTTIIEGNLVKFEVFASNADYYQWKSGSENVGTNNNYYSFTASLSHNDKSVWCIVSNDYGSDTSGQVYLTVLPNHYTTFFWDEFNSDYYNWPIKNETYLTTEISDGYYNVSWDNDGYLYRLPMRFPDLNIRGDYTVEISAEYIDGLPNSFFGLIFYSDNVNFYYFGIDNGKHFKIICDNSTWNDLVNDYKCAINSNTSNILKIIKVGNYTYFFINDVFVAEQYISQIYGNIFGFFVSHKIQVRFDYIKITL